MTTRQWCLRTLIALMLGLAYVNPVAAQVDPGDTPSSLSFADADTIRAFRACMKHAELRDEINSCFAIGPVRGLCFRRFYADVFLGKLTFGAPGAGLDLHFVVRHNANQTILGHSTSIASVVPDRVVIPDQATFDYLAWVFSDRTSDLVEFLGQGQLVSVVTDRISAGRTDRFTCIFGYNTSTPSSFQTQSLSRTLQLSASYAAARGYFDVAVQSEVTK